MRATSRRALILCLVGLAPIAAPWRNSRAQGVDNDLASDGNHMIFQRINQDDFNAVRAYLDAGLDPNIRGFMDQTASIWAAECNCWRMVEILIEHGADLSLADRQGITVARVVEESLELGNIRLSAPDGQAFLRVQDILRERGLL